tara:strand:+ start:18748 stop:19503 length:756 start_codon:yes stop_codon:yes gene_type:complete
MEQRNRTAIITGASRGIGAAIALDLANRGYDIALNDIISEITSLNAVAAEIEEMGQRVETYLYDVSIKDNVEEMAKNVISDFGEIDVVVNNAGILVLGEVDGLSENIWDKVMNVNAKGSFLVIQSFLPAMKSRKYGRIVNIASIGGKHGAPRQAHYSASKAAMMGFSRVLSQEVGVFGITVNCVCPGIIMTEMGRANLEIPEVQAEWKSKTAMGRIGEPQDIVGAVAFFASNDASFITGQSLNVDGGIVMS